MDYRVKCNSCSMVVINGHPCHEIGCPNPITIYRDEKGREFNSFRLITYGVWGNYKDGYEVNDCSKTGITLLLDDQCTKEDVVKGLKEKGFFSKRMRFSSVDLSWGHEHVCELTWAQTEQPIGRLEAE